MENEQAFPGAYCVGPSDDLYPPAPGMTMRDYFAGQALAGPVHQQCVNITIQVGDYTAKALAEMAYAIADAMMETRK
jgi:hypothetical protein